VSSNTSSGNGRRADTSSGDGLSEVIEREDSGVSLIG